MRQHAYRLQWAMHQLIVLRIDASVLLPTGLHATLVQQDARRTRASNLRPSAEDDRIV